LDSGDIKTNKKLKKSQQILDHMGSEELAANLFRTTQADAKLRRENVKNEMNANLTHYDVGQKVRKTIEELGGTMPEELPTTDGIGKAKTLLKNRSDKKKLEGGDKSI
jgi:DNA-damage-inducible protein D